MNQQHIGVIMGVGAGAIWAIEVIPGKLLALHVDSFMIVFLRFAIAASILLPSLIALNQLAVTSISQALLGVLVGFGYILYYEGLKRIKASEIALTELSAPFIAAMLAWLFLGEAVTLLQSIGIFLLFSGLYLITRDPGVDAAPDSHGGGASNPF